jgi:hypothetical protein
MRFRKFARKSGLSLAVFCGFGGLALAASVHDPIFWKQAVKVIAEAQAKGDHRTAYNEAVILALAGETTGYDVLVQSYAEGQGVAADPAMAARVACVGAERGQRTSAMRLAKFYLDGKGLPADPARALMWAEIAGRGLAESLREQMGVNNVRQLAESSMPMAQVDNIRAVAKAWTPAPTTPADRYGRYCP